MVSCGVFIEYILMLISIFCYIVDMPNTDWCSEMAATLLMWSGSEVTHAILGNRVLNYSYMSEELNVEVYTLAHVCAKQDREENGSRHLRYKHCLHCTYKALNFVYVNACL